MPFFSQIDECNRRRFISPNNEILAIYDQAKSYTFYAQVGADDEGQICFVSEPRFYWPDEIEEVHS
jgi:hypothetical protein